VPFSDSCWFDAAPGSSLATYCDCTIFVFVGWISRPSSVASTRLTVDRVLCCCVVPRICPACGFADFLKEWTSVKGSSIPLSSIDGDVIDHIFERGRAEQLSRQSDEDERSELSNSAHALG